jgi:hypothetical protein
MIRKLQQNREQLIQMIEKNLRKKYQDEELKMKKILK